MKLSITTTSLFRECNFICLFKHLCSVNWLIHLKQKQQHHMNTFDFICLLLTSKQNDLG